MHEATSIIQDRRQALQVAITNAERAAALEAEVESLRRDLRRIEGRRDTLAGVRYAATKSWHVLRRSNQGYVDRDQLRAAAAELEPHLLGPLVLGDHRQEIVGAPWASRGGRSRRI